MAVNVYTFVRTNTGRYTILVPGTPMNVRRFDDSVAIGMPTLVETVAISAGTSPSLSIRPDQSLDLLYSTSSEIRHRRSTDRGKTWTAATTAHSGYGNCSSAWDRKRSRLVAAIQDASTLDWYLTTATLGSSGVIGSWSTPTLITAASEDLSACVRVGADGRYGFTWGDAGAVYYVESEDGGETWGTPYTVIGSGWRSPSFDWCPKQQALVVAMQSTTPVAVGSFNSYSWFLSVAPLDADGKPTVWAPSSYNINPTVVAFVNTMTDLAFINWGNANGGGVQAGCLRAHPDGRLTFCNFGLTGTVDLIKTSVFSVSGKWRAVPFP